MAGQLDDRALRGHVAIDDGVGAARHDGGVHAGDDLLARRLFGFSGFGEQAAAGDGRGVDDLARLGQALGDQARAARREQVRGQEASAWLQVADDRSLDAGLMAVLDAEVDAGLGGDSGQVHDGVGRSARGRDRDSGVLQAGAGDVFAGGVAGEDALDDQAAAALAFRALARIDGGDVVGAHGADAHHRQGHGHGVGGELAAAGAGAGADRALDRLQALVGQGAGAVGADGLEHLLDRDLLLADPAGQDGAAVIDQAGDIHPRQGHGRRRDGLVAADDADDAVQLMPLDRQLDGVGDDLAADQRGLHARRAHGDAVGDDDGVEIDRIAARRDDSGAHVLGQAVQVHVARRDRRPGVDDGDHRLVEVGVLHPCGAQIGARRSPVRPLGDGGTARIGLFFAVGRVGHRIFGRFCLSGLCWAHEKPRCRVGAG
ncbi:hypothetical protein D3C71_1068600 [compost metagenome]